MTPYNIVPTFNGVDDQPIYVSRKDFSGGANSRLHASKIGENQAEQVDNFDLGVPGYMVKTAGVALVEDLGNDAGTGLFSYEPDGSTFQLVATHGQKLETWAGSSTFTERKADFTTNLQTTMFKAGESGEGDVLFVGNGTDNWFRFEPGDLGTPQDLGNTAGTGTDSPPISKVGAYYRNRVWILKDNLLYFSAAYSADYSGAFDTVSDAFRIPVGSERAVLGIRDLGLLVMGADATWGLNPSVTPAPTTDKPEKILDIGTVAGDTAVQVGDDVLFLATDGVRGVLRTQQDKLQMGSSYPLNYALKNEHNSISWAYVTKASAVYWDNKYILTLPVDGSAYNNEVWIYYPALGSWQVITGWNVAKFAKFTVSGEERLYAIDSQDGTVYRAFNGNNYNGAAITATFIGREEDGGNPFSAKSGGTLEIEALASDSGTSFAISIAIDGANFQSIGSVSLSSATAPVLPVNLPFSLSDYYIIRQKFPLESYGEWRTLQVKIVNNDDNTDTIAFYGYNLKTFNAEVIDV